MQSNSLTLEQDWVTQPAYNTGIDEDVFGLCFYLRTFWVTRVAKISLFSSLPLIPSILKK